MKKNHKTKSPIIQIWSDEIEKKIKIGILKTKQITNKITRGKIKNKKKSIKEK